MHRLDKPQHPPGRMIRMGVLVRKEPVVEVFGLADVDGFLIDSLKINIGGFP